MDSIKEALQILLLIGATIACVLSIIDKWLTIKIKRKKLKR